MWLMSLFLPVYILPWLTGDFFLLAYKAYFPLQAIKKREQAEEPKTDDEEPVEDVHDGELHL